MKAKVISNSQTELFQNRLSNQLNPKNELLILSDKINWQEYEESFGSLYSDGPGQPPKAIRLMVGLLKLQHMYGLSDEEVVHTWVENPYWQYFCGYDYLQWELPINPSSLTRFRGRLGKEGLEKILSQTITIALSMGVVKKKDLAKVTVDTTVMEKNITYPTDSKLYHRARKKLVTQAKINNIELRQTYTRLSKVSLIKSGRYAHANQYRRMKKEVKKLKNYLGRVVRDIERKTASKATSRELTSLLYPINLKTRSLAFGNYR